MADLSESMEGTPAAATGSGPLASGEVRFKRNIFIRQETTGVRVGDNLRREEGTRPEFVTMGEDLKKQYSTFLDDYVRNLSELNRSHPDVLQNEYHTHDRELMQLLSNDSGEPDDAKINKFLEKPEGWIITTQALEHQTALKLFALGAYAANNPQGERRTMITPQRIRLGINEGILSRFYHEDVQPRVARVAEAVRGLARGSATLDLKQCSEVLRIIKNNPDEAEFVRQMAGIDVDDFRIDPVTNEVTPSAGVPETNDIDGLTNDIVQGLYTREQFYTTLGVPRSKLDGMPEQFLAGYSTGQQEATRTRWQAEINEVFDPNWDGIQDRAGNVPSDAGFNVNDLDYESNITRFMNARREIMMRHVSRYIEGQSVKDANSGALKIIEEKINGFKEGGKEREKRIKELNDKEATLKKDIDTTLLEKATVNEYTAAKNALEEARQALTREFPAITGAAGITTEIQRNQDYLNTTYHNDQNSLSEEREEQIRRTQAGLTFPAKTPPETIDRAMQRAEERITNLFNVRLQRLEANAGTARNQIVRLTELQNTLSEKQRTLGGKEDTVINSAKEDLNAFTLDFDALTGWGIPEAQLRTGSVNELMTAINTANAADPTHGWTATENSNPDNKARIIRAISEEKARYEENFNAEKPARDVEYDALTGWGITPDQLRTMSNTQLQTLVNRANATNPAHGWTATENDANKERLQLGVAEAKNRLVTRHAVWTDEKIKDLDAGIKDIQQEKGNVKFEKEIQKLEITRDVIKRQGEIYSNASVVTANRDRYVDRTGVTTADTTSTQEERDAHVQRGYLEMMNLMFDYKSRSDRGDYFRRIHQVLPPQRLAQILNENPSLNLGVAYADVNIDTILTALDTSLRSGRNGSLELRSGFKDVINRLKDEAVVL